jgi:hypothetical protein
MPKKKSKENNKKWYKSTKTIIVLATLAVPILLFIIDKSFFPSSPSIKMDESGIVTKTEKTYNINTPGNAHRPDKANRTDEVIKPERIDKLEATVLFPESYETPRNDTVKLVYAIKNSGTETAILSRFYSQYFIGENFPSSFGVGKLIDLTPYPITIKTGDIYIIKHKFRSVNNELYVMDGYPDSSTADPNKYRYAYLGISWLCIYTGIEYSWESKIFKIHMKAGRDWWSSDTIQSTSELINTEPINLCIHPMKRIK